VTQRSYTRYTGPRSLRAVMREGHGQRHSAAGARSNIRPVLYHQGSRQGNRSWPITGARHRCRPRRRDRRLHRHRYRHDVYALAAQRRRDDRAFGRTRGPSSAWPGPEGPRRRQRKIAGLAEEILAELGYEPVGFSSSIAALRAFRESPQRFDIVLTDESMPELAGTALAGEIALLRPDLPIVLMSGFAGAQLQERARALGVRELLRKPLQRQDIAECLGRVLPG
jgi:CheY-like chemotaxis protein